MVHPGAYRGTKRQKELKRLQKQEEKRQKRIQKGQPGEEGGPVPGGGPEIDWSATQPSEPVSSTQSTEGSLPGPASENGAPKEGT